MDRQKWREVTRDIYAILMSILLLGYLAVIATYKETMITGQSFQFPVLFWFLCLFTAVMAIWLGRLWKDKGFLILMVYLLLKAVRVAADNPEYIFLNSVSESLLTGFWVFSACYGLARILTKDQLKRFIKLNAAIWTAGMTVYSIIGLYATWTDQSVYTIGQGAILGSQPIYPGEPARLFLAYYPTTSGAVLSISAIIAGAGALLSKQKANKALFIIAVIPMLTALSLTDTRSAIVSVSAGLAMVIGIAALSIMRKKATEKGKKEVAAWLGAIAVTGIAFAAIFLSCRMMTSVFNQLRITGFLVPRAMAEGTGKAALSNRGFSGDNVLSGRTKIWRSVIELLKQNPKLLLTGTSILNPMKMVNNTNPHCHNMPLMILLENGIPGLMLMGLFLGRAVTCALRLIKRNRWEQLTVPMVLSVATGELVECFTWLRAGIAPVLPVFFISLGIILANGTKRKQPDAGIANQCVTTAFESSENETSSMGLLC